MFNIIKLIKMITLGKARVENSLMAGLFADDLPLCGNVRLRSPGLLAIAFF